MAISVSDLLDQLAEDESRTPQLQMYLDAATKWIKNAITSDNKEVSFFDIASASQLLDLAILSYSMDLWTHRSETMPPSTAVWHMVGQLRGLYDSWKEEQDESIQA